MFAIQKAVPRPKALRSPGAVKRRKYPYEEMEVDDMFFIPNKEKNTVTTHMAAVGKKLERKYSSKLTYMVHVGDNVWLPAAADTPNAVLGIGVWRDA